MTDPPASFVRLLVWVLTLGLVDLHIPDDDPADVPEWAQSHDA